MKQNNIVFNIILVIAIIIAIVANIFVFLHFNGKISEIAKETQAIAEQNDKLSDANNSYEQTIKTNKSFQNEPTKKNPYSKKIKYLTKAGNVIANQQSKISRFIVDSTSENSTAMVMPPEELFKVFKKYFDDPTTVVAWHTGSKPLKFKFVSTFDRVFSNTVDVLWIGYQNNTAMMFIASTYNFNEKLFTAPTITYLETEEQKKAKEDARYDSENYNN